MMVYEYQVPLQQKKKNFYTALSKQKQFHNLTDVLQALPFPTKICEQHK